MPGNSKFAVLVLFSSSLLFAQGYNDTFRARIRGNGNSESGKCTIEVRIDEAAEVEFSGDTGRLRTLAGQPATWTRIDCSAPMPSSMANFRFKGIDGRGRQTLIADPRQNRGVAVVRLEDPRPGTEGYTFDLEWSGGSRYSTGPGPTPYPDRGDNYNGNYNRDLIRCSSEDGYRRYCNADTRRGVRLVRQYGEACRQGETWGYDDRGIWVDRGCRGEFQLGR